MIIDAHIHVGGWDHPDFLGRGCDLDEALAALARAGVDGAAMMPSDRCENEALLEAMKRRVGEGAGPLWFFPWVRLGEAADLALITRRRRDVCGLKIHPSLSRVRVTDEAFRPFLDKAEDERWVVLVHCGRWQEVAGWAHAVEAAVRHPGARFLFAHAGGDTPPNATNAARAVAERSLDNVWFELSGLREYWVVERNVKLLGAHRYLLGSDFPLSHPAMYIGAVGAMNLSESERRLILGHNARALFGEPLGGAT